MTSEEMMQSGQYLVSPDGKSFLTLDNDCNLDLRQNGRVKSYIERSSVEVKGPCFLKINKKGSLILVSSNVKVSVLATSTIKGAALYQLILDNNADLTMYALEDAWTLGVKPQPKALYVNEDEYLTDSTTA
eukprot:TRINITY_DN480_c0_g3_i3.p1 TRINITY_DN480_c0_g3~~TRINITY_DN480_c0_g3_i3.p1  ORF type:complete len:131 (+),score=37.22 TRINITY_DN480_c0_g3_i3:199-591(+)